MGGLHCWRLCALAGAAMTWPNVKRSRRYEKLIMEEARAKAAEPSSRSGTVAGSRSSIAHPIRQNGSSNKRVNDEPRK